MTKIQVYLPEEDARALRLVGRRSGRSVAAVVRDAIREVIPEQPERGPVAIWDGEPRRPSTDHDMKRLGLGLAFAFDHHFAVAGLRLVG